MKQSSLAELKRRYLDLGYPLPHELRAQLVHDPRRGARALLEAIEKRRREHRSEGQRLRHMLRFENEIWATGVKRIAGIDEAGVSPLAGPVVAAAAVFPVGYRLAEVDDSKKLDAGTRARLAERIKAEAIGWAVGIVSAEEIDRINIYRAGLLAMRRAVEALPTTPEYLLIDARKLKELAVPQRAIVRGDQLSFSIAGASILAKTSRDAMMDRYELEYPGWAFSKHKGYPVREHLDAIAKCGVCPIHRRSFGPVRRALGREATQTELFSEASDERGTNCAD